MAKKAILIELKLDDLKTQLDGLETKPKTAFTVKEIAQECKSQIANVLKKGYSFIEICDLIFKPHGYNIDPNYLRLEYNKLLRKPRAVVKQQIGSVTGEATN